MSRRPRGPGMDPGAASRMAPGGRMWSEAPIPRVAVRRVRQMGAPSGWEATDVGYSSASPPYPSFVCTWEDVIDFGPVTASCVGRFVFTLTAVDPSVSWFQIDAAGFATGGSVFIPADPHYRFRSGSPTESVQASGSRAITVSGGPFPVGHVVDVTFPADDMFNSWDAPAGFYNTLDFAMPPTFTCASATFHIVSP